jgi:hypothetical protein
MDQPDFDIAAAHKYFSAYCFNTAWDYIDKPNRTSEDDQTMIQLCLAALWHWSQRPDCSPRSLAIGYWQASRIYSLLGQVNNARRYALLSLEVSQNEEPFYIGYAYEALARAELVAGNRQQMQDYLEKAQKFAAQVTDPEEKQLLDADLETIR